ncbi:MAG: EFR1 family ferrodoxin [Muribaculaceae bacterium]|nr:EFR1 family ferrodoxin [Roseburia sp.]MCM1430863.1 EFR1 family ferrodoxin [Muribaculaceae bacterium]MCM1492842.1 EFR1 family ferrodoxin [Muribaculaceae bacterium]
MPGIYFSGTGNTKFCVGRFLKEYDNNENLFSIEDHRALEQIQAHNEIVIGYPVQYSNIPKIVRDYIINHSQIWKGKHIFIIATMGLFSGDGAGMAARLLHKYGAVIVGGLHVKMPDCISDVKALKRNFEENKSIVMNAEQKISKAAQDVKNGTPPQEGLGIFYHLAGLFGQRLYFYGKTKEYTDKLKINPQKCIGCGLCEKLCPMDNITLKNGIAISSDQCTMCYRCISKCPRQAITLLGKQVIEQNDINKYL